MCTVSAQEIARLVNDDPSGSVFDPNLRKFLGGRGAVDKDIMETWTGSPKKTSGLIRSWSLCSSRAHRTNLAMN